MLTKELKKEIQTVLKKNIGIMMYAVVKKDEGIDVKFVNIADENKSDINSGDDNTAQGLLVGFTDIVCKKMNDYDEESEILKLSSADERRNALYYYDLEQLPYEMQLMKKVSDERKNIDVFNFKDDLLSEIIAFIIVLGNDKSKIILYKQQYSISLLHRDKCMLTPVLHKNRLARLEKDILRIDFNYQFLLWNNAVYISDIEKMEKICSFHNIIRNEAKKSISQIEKMDIVDNIETLTDELDNITFARKLTRIYKDSKVVGKVSNKDIIDFAQTHSYFKNNPIKLTESKEKFILDTKKSKAAFIKLLNDDLLTSQLTNSDYEALAKNSA